MVETVWSIYVILIFMDSLLQKIETSPVYDVVNNTPIQALTRLSSLLGNNIYLKREDLQPVHSFKIRGAYQKIYALSESQKKKGIIAASAGNHAQGVAYSARTLSISSVIVMPVTTPEIKVDSVRRLGAELVLFGDSYDEACEHALALSAEKSLTFIHPYDDDDVIAGQGTIGKEIISHFSESPPDVVFICVGGGGLIAGVAAYIKSVSPSTKVVSVEHEGSACFHAALQEKSRVILPHVDLFVDGVAVKQVGKRPFEIASSLIDESILISTDEICASIKDIYDDCRAIAEPSGALSLAGLKAYVAKHDCQDQTMVSLLSGANMNFHRLRHVSERAEIGEHKEVLFSVTIPEEKGSFLKFCSLLERRSVTEFNYRYSGSKEAHIFVGLELTPDEDDGSSIQKLLTDNNYDYCDLTHNDVAKLHIRYMVGGVCSDLNNERLYRFQFPEKPGALLHFLSSVGSRWNISLFHYRNHGAAYGRVLLGIQIDDDSLEAFNSFLTTIGYIYFDETANPAYSLFL